jgi:predicted AlkP superfamily pyrophosphatase or phosphodiesterase
MGKNMEERPGRGPAQYGSRRAASRIPEARGIRGALIVMATAILTLAMPGCGEDPASPEKVQPRILIIGVDGASPRITFPMMKAGKLPNLAKLAAEGVSGPLRSVLPLYSPRIWNTIATGRTAPDHGIAAFVHENDDGERTLYLSSDRQVPALWNILSAAERTVGVVNWWTTYPPEKINGVMVSDHFFPEQISTFKNFFKDRQASDGALLHPVSWSPRAEERLLDTTPPTDFSDFLLDNEALPHWLVRPTLSQQFVTDEKVVRVALGLQADFRPDVLMVYLPGIDRVSHWLWGNIEPAELYPPNVQPNDDERRAGAEALRNYYAFTDALIGRLVEGYGPDDLVLVVSDHGFEAGVGLTVLTGSHDTLKAVDGVLFARGRGIPADWPAGPVNVYEIAPSVLAFAGLPIARDMVAGPAPFMGQREFESVASYNEIPIERYAPAKSGNEEDIIEHLRTLGYLEDETDPESNEKPSTP